jgi:hypothetical protein
MSDHPTNPDTWGIRDENIVTGQTNVLEQSVALARRSDGTMVCFYTRTPVSTFNKVAYKIRSAAGVWGSETVLDSAVSVHNSHVVGVLDANDVFHIGYQDHTNGIYYYNTLSASDVLGSRVTVTTDGGTAEGQRQGILPLVMKGSDVVFAYIKKSTTKIAMKLISGGTPGTEVTISDNTVATDPGPDENSTTSRQPVASLAVDGSNLYLLYADLTTLDIFFDKDEGSGWGTDTEEKDAVSAHWIRAGVLTHSAGNGGQKVLAYLWDNGSGNLGNNTYYGEKPL